MSRYRQLRGPVTRIRTSFVAIALVLLVACESPAPAVTDPSGSRPSETAARPATLKVAFVKDLAVPDADEHALPAFQAAELAFRTGVLADADGRVRAAMVRRGRSWINNVAQGASCEAVEPAGELCELAEGACRALEIDYAGVDLIRDGDGRVLVVEANGIPAWKGLQSVSRIDIARALADDFLERCLPRRALHSVA